MFREFGRPGPVAIAWLVGQACWAEEADAEEAISWHSSKLSKIEKEWQLLHVAYDRYDIPGERGKDQYTPTKRRTAFSASPPSPPSPAGLAAGHNFTRRESRGRAPTATTPPPSPPPHHHHSTSITISKTFHSAQAAAASDELSQIPETRKDLAAAVRRGFAGLGITGQDDAEYVKNAMCWYEKEKDNVIR